MVLVLKVISCAINYNDGLLKEEDLSEAQKKNRLLKLPSLVEYIGYCLCCGSHLAGPVYEMKDYLDWTEGTEVNSTILVLFIINFCYGSSVAVNLTSTLLCFLALGTL